MGLAADDRSKSDRNLTGATGALPDAAPVSFSAKGTPAITGSPSGASEEPKRAGVVPIPAKSVTRSGRTRSRDSGVQSPDDTDKRGMSPCSSMPLPLLPAPNRASLRRPR